MTIIELIATVIAGVAIPYVVALIKGQTIAGEKARWLAIGLSILSGVVVAFIAGIPTTPDQVLLCIFSAIGAMQAAYAVFQGVGITCGWLDALSNIRKPSDDVATMQKNQALADKAEEKVRKGTDEA